MFALSYLQDQIVAVLKVWITSAENLFECSYYWYLLLNN